MTAQRNIISFSLIHGTYSGVLRAPGLFFYSYKSMCFFSLFFFLARTYCFVSKYRYCMFYRFNLFICFGIINLILKDKEGCRVICVYINILIHNFIKHSLMYYYLTDTLFISTVSVCRYSFLPKFPNFCINLMILKFLRSFFMY